MGLYSAWYVTKFYIKNVHTVVLQLFKFHFFRCDKSLTNTSNQTALDIAKFWGYKNIANLLTNVEDGLEPFFLTNEIREQENYFCRTFLDRKSEKRVDPKWLSIKQKQPSTVYILFSDLNPLAVSEGGEESSRNPHVKLCRLGYQDVKEYLKLPETVTLIFLGVKLQQTTDSLHPTQNGKEPNEDDDGLVAWFALSIDASASKKLIQQHQGSYFLHPPMRALLQFSECEAGKTSKHL